MSLRCATVSTAISHLICFCWHSITIFRATCFAFVYDTYCILINIVHHLLFLLVFAKHFDDDFLLTIRKWKVLFKWIRFLVYFYLGFVSFRFHWYLIALGCMNWLRCRPSFRRWNCDFWQHNFSINACVPGWSERNWRKKEQFCRAAHLKKLTIWSRITKGSWTVSWTSVKNVQLIPPKKGKIRFTFIKKIFWSTA